MYNFVVEFLPVSARCCKAHLLERLQHSVQKDKNESPGTLGGQKDIILMNKSCLAVVSGAWITMEVSSYPCS